MKLLYTGATYCSEPTLKRLLLIGSELVFMDRPAVSFDKWGTIGHASPFRQLDSEGEPVKIAVHRPPRGPADNLYGPYAAADFENPEFVRIFLEGLRVDEVFARKLIQTESTYADGVSGQMILDQLAADPSLTPLPLTSAFDTEAMFRMRSANDLRAIFRMILADASIQVTSALVVAHELHAAPISDDPYFLRLLSERTSAAKYVGGSAPHAWLIGLEFAKAVIPDEALQKLSIADVLAYRRKTKDVFQAWTEELNKLAEKMDDVSLVDASARISRLLLIELQPRITAYEAEMTNARDALFGDLIKSVANWKVPALSLGSMAAMGFGAAMATFATTALGGAAAPIVDFIRAKRLAGRKHPVSYLVRLVESS
jgi:hypothetical protein